MSERVPYMDIPREVRDVLDDVYLPEGVEIWWNARNSMLGGRRPAEAPEAAGDVLRIANMLADGNFA